MSRYGKSGALLALLALLPGAAWALGLGQIQSDTRIGQTLSARIPILAADADVLQGLSVGLASPDAYKQAGLREPDFLFNLKFQVAQGTGGSPYVLVTSTEPVRLPFLNLLVHASWSSGEVTRQYTLLLNPPVFAAGSPGAVESAPVAPAEQPAYRTPPAAPAREVPPPAPNMQPRRYGPVERGTTLWGIASRLASADGVGVNRMMIALYRANPQAFAGNINRLKTGPVLRVPSASEIEAISLAAANREVAAQNREWASTRTAGGERSVAVASSNRGGQSGATQGEVILTAPETTETIAIAAVPGTVTAAGAAAGAAVKAVGNNGGTGQMTAARAASVGGPAKVRSYAMANLAAAGQLAEKAHPAKDAFNSVNAANSDTGEKAEGTIRNWLTTPKGWIVIALILLLIALLIFLYSRRARNRPPPAAQERTVALSPPVEGAAAHDAHVGVPVDVVAYEDDALVAESDEDLTGLDWDTVSHPHETPQATSGEDYAGKDGTPEDAAAFKSEFYFDEAGTADALAGADFYAGHGDHAGAADVLRTALAGEPERHDLHRRLLAELFAAGDAQGFRAEAARFRERLPTESDWQAVAIMGRQLMPGDELFGAGAATQDEGALDFDMELDRLSGPESPRNLQDDFERTLGELSTMIETYVPGSGERPLELQLPPDEIAKMPQTAAADEDMPLDFVPDETERQPETETVVAFEPGAEGTLPAVPSSSQEEGVAGTQLDLARAYLDMDDRESARDILEEVLDGGDEAQRKEAQRLLETLS